MNNKQDKGFTLVELLIVIVILGILATVTVFAVRGITDQGQENACDVERRTIETAIEAYYADNDQVGRRLSQRRHGRRSWYL
jgi:prepilin-type N-terminal cleavage/methylation domain-containing protein